MRTTLHLVQRECEVLLCRYVLQHHSQFSSVLHGGVQTFLRLQKNSLSFVWTRCWRCSKGWLEAIPWAAERTTPLSGCQAPRIQRSTPPLPGICFERSDRGATQKPADFGSPAASGWWCTAKQEQHLKLEQLAAACRPCDQSCYWWVKNGEAAHLPGSHTHPQVLVENRVDGVGFDTRLSLAMPGCVWQQVSLHITNTDSTETQWVSQKPQNTSL